jgi:hypothetical protein
MSASATVLPEKATHQQTRTFTQQLVLRALHDHTPLSRADLARLTGWTRNAAAGPALLDPIRSRIARERAASRLVQAALGDATVELLSPTEAPGARAGAAMERHRIGLPEREGVGER